MAIIVADKRGNIDSAYHTLVKHIPSSLPIVMVSWCDNYVFNEALLDIKDYILICYCEEGWDVPIIDTHLWGINSDKFPRYNNGDWIKFDNWVKENPPKLTFKRELLKKDVTDTMRPIDYPCSLLSWNVQSKEIFNARPLSCFQYWGRSNECRLRIHSEIWHHATEKGFSVCDNFYYIKQFIKEESGEKWVTLNIPHYVRMDIAHLLEINNLSKLSLSWPGAGFKCFRTQESPTNSTLVMQKNDFAFAFDWNESNCILVEPGKEIEGIDAALNRPDLYEIYSRGIENNKNYQTVNYINNYILPILNKI